MANPNEEQETQTIAEQLASAFNEPDPKDTDGAPDPELGDQSSGGATQPVAGSDPAGTAEGDGTTDESGNDEEQPAKTDNGNAGADTEPKDGGADDEPKLILGKFKSHEDLEKAYVNLEKMASKNAQRANEEQKFTSPTEFEQAIADKIEVAALKQIEDAVSRIPNSQDLKEASAAVSMYRRTGDLQFIEKARSFLDRTADRRLENELRETALGIKQDMNARRDEIMLEPIRQGLAELVEEDREWMEDTLHQDVLKAAIQLNSRVNVKAIKKMVDDIAVNAVEKYKAAEAKKRVVENSKKPNVSIKTSPGIIEKKSEKPFEAMTLEEQLQAAYDKKFKEK